jgi:DNA-binding SARP family transcriptional activator
MVDLHSSRFRVRDVAGNAVDLPDVANAVEVAHLVGDRVRARGVLRRGSSTQHHRLEGSVVEAAPPIADRLGIAPSATLDQLLEAARRVPAPPPIEISDAEMDEFLAAISQ